MNIETHCHAGGEHSSVSFSSSLAMLCYYSVSKEICLRLEGSSQLIIENVASTQKHQRSTDYSLNLEVLKTFTVSRHLGQFVKV